MSTNGDTQENNEQTRQRLIALLKEMSGKDLDVVEKFALFIRQQGGQSVVAVVEREGEILYQYPTVSVPASVFSELAGIMPPVGGNALTDTESLYDGT
jgi:hypothetical protein